MVGRGCECERELERPATEPLEREQCDAGPRESPETETRECTRLALALPSEQFAIERLERERCERERSVRGDWTVASAAAAWRGPVDTDLSIGNSLAVGESSALRLTSENNCRAKRARNHIQWAET